MDQTEACLGEPCLRVASKEIDMRIHSLVTRSCLAFFLVLQGSCANSSPQKLSERHEALPARNTEQPASDKERIEQQISKEKAIAIANEDAAKKSQSLESFKAVPCEQAWLWVIIYDGGGPEYYIDKKSGAILSVWRLSQALNDNAASSESRSGAGIGEIEAIEIAKKHFVDFLVSQGDAKDHVNAYDAVACELANAWRVFFEYRAAPGQNRATLPNSNPPNYVIDKKSGKIMFTTHRIAK